jgi:hypothetical protein
VSIPRSPYLAWQFSGDVIQSCVEGVQASFDATASLISYWNLLSLSTASGGELDFMGALAGFPRPLVPPNFTSPNLFTYGAAAGWETVDVQTGFGSTANPGTGGQYVSAIGSIANPMPDSWYRVAIPLVALLKYYGITLYSVDQLVGGIAALYGTTYTFAYAANGDILAAFVAHIPYPALWTLQKIFNYYETDCVVFLSSP